MLLTSWSCTMQEIRYNNCCETLTKIITYQDIKTRSLTLHNLI